MDLGGGRTPKRDLVGVHVRDCEGGPGVQAGYASDAGPRASNQDRATATAFWAAISDGAGGHAGGDIAAELAIEGVMSRLGRPSTGVQESCVLEAFSAANSAVRARRRTDARMANAAATLTIAACTSLHPSTSQWVIANLGDSPVWHSRGDHLDRLSEEHNLAAELVRSGVLSPTKSRSHPGRHIVTRALGVADEVVPHVSHATLKPGDLLILASDGVEVLTEAEIAAVAGRRSDARGTAVGLVDAALSAGATDNVTAVVLRYVGNIETRRGLFVKLWGGSDRP
jgi:PPM family protein phosphatase